MPKKLRLGVASTLTLIMLTTFSAPAHAAVLFSSIWNLNTLNFGLNSNYWAAHKFYAANATTISTVDIYSDSQIDRITIRGDSASAPGSVLATFTYSSVSGNVYTYTGSFTTTAGTTYWLTYQSARTTGNDLIAASQTASDVTSAGISSSGVVLSSQNSGSTWGTQSVSAYNWLKFRLNSVSPSLTTPSAPVISSITNTSLSVSEASATTNAVNYQINLYQSNGTTLVESKTVSTITTPTTFSNLSPGTTYKVSVTANGDTTNYSNSAASSQSSATTTAIASISLSSATTANYWTSTSIVATVAGGEGRVTFTANGKRIPGCVAKATASLAVTCSYRSSLRGSVVISAVFKPTNPVLNMATATAKLQVSKRSSLR